MGVKKLQQRDILLLTDYRGHFYESVRSRGANLDLERMKMYFSDMGYTSKVMQFGDIEFNNNNYNGYPVLYQSSEDPGLLYKDYIEDILLGLSLQGARLIPDFPKFRAHHNKVFMEVLRSINGHLSASGISSKQYGTFEDFARDIELQPKKLVMKPAGGARSCGVRLTDGHKAQLRYARKLSSSFDTIEWLKVLVNSIIRKNYSKKSLHRRKFVVQEFLSGLGGDYKIVIYGKKYYVLERKNRKNDFRASGSGNFSFPVFPPDELLNFSYDLFAGFNVPFLSMDIAKFENRYVLLEFQFLSFGNYTLERSEFYFTRNVDSGWTKVEETPDLEREFVSSVVRYLEIAPK